MLPRAMGPRFDGSTGTSRQPITANRRLFKTASIAETASASTDGSVDKKTIPTANKSPSSTPQASDAACRMNASGIWNNNPQPSPVFPSAAIPPRCVIRVNASIEVINKS